MVREVGPQGREAPLDGLHEAREAAVPGHRGDDRRQKCSEGQEGQEGPSQAEGYAQGTAEGCREPREHGEEGVPEEDILKEETQPHGEPAHEDRGGEHAGEIPAREGRDDAEEATLQGDGEHGAQGTHHGAEGLEQGGDEGDAQDPSPAGAVTRQDKHGVLEQGQKMALERNPARVQEAAEADLHGPAHAGVLSDAGRLQLLGHGRQASLGVVQGLGVQIDVHVFADVEGRQELGEEAFLHHEDQHAVGEHAPPVEERGPACAGQLQRTDVVHDPAQHLALPEPGRETSLEIGAHLVVEGEVGDDGVAPG